jgi:hypothetical protein
LRVVFIIQSHVVNDWQTPTDDDQRSTKRQIREEKHSDEIRRDSTCPHSRKCHVVEHEDAEFEQRAAFTENSTFHGFAERVRPIISQSCRPISRAYQSQRCGKLFLHVRFRRRICYILRTIGQEASSSRLITIWKRTSFPRSIRGRFPRGILERELA